MIRKLCRIIFIACVLAAGTVLAGRAGGSLDANGPGRLEQAVRDAAVACYSTEGRYPASVGYLTSRYGLRPDGRYEIHYRIFASNLPPEIDVTARTGD